MQNQSPWCYRPNLPSSEWPERKRAEPLYAEQQIGPIQTGPVAPSGHNRVLYNVAFGWNVFFTALVAVLFIPLTILFHSLFQTWILTFFLVFPIAWGVYLTIGAWRITKGTKQNTTGFGVINLVFMALVSGIVLLIARKGR